jgi:hypothetical protein
VRPNKTTISLDRMDLENNTLTISITNPEVRYEYDYVAKGVIFFLPIDTAGRALVTARKYFLTSQRRNVL